MTALAIVGIIIAAFIGSMAGAALAPLVVEYVGKPLRNRAEHRQILDRERFEMEWGKSAWDFFRRKDGFGRG